MQGSGGPAKVPGGASAARWALLGLNLLTAALLVFLSIDWWGRLPGAPPLPKEYAQGAWALSGFWNWFLLPLLGVTISVFFLGARILHGAAHRHPWLLSLPCRALFLRLPAEGRRRVLDAAFLRLSLFPLPIHLFLLYGQWVNFRIARGHPSEIAWLPRILFLGAALALLLLYLAGLHAAIRREAALAGIAPETGDIPSPGAPTGGQAASP